MTPKTDSNPFLPRFDRGNCGIGFVADQYGRASHALLALGLESLINLEHRGAADADARTGDGAGLLTPLPSRLLAREAERLTGQRVDPAALGVGVFFLPAEGRGPTARPKPRPRWPQQRRRAAVLAADPIVARGAG